MAKMPVGKYIHPQLDVREFSMIFAGLSAMQRLIRLARPEGHDLWKDHEFLWVMASSEGAVTPLTLEEVEGLMARMLRL